ncbi:MAG TPA: hypothetical protein VFT37_03725 [Telluria sp.]|nr:hypothetical protein [Telluria sp.]
MDTPLTANLQPQARSLYGPWADVLLLGGGSVIAMLLLRALDLEGESIVVLAGVMLFLANFMNHPHFAVSYQIFYSSWADVKSGAMPADLRRRWWIAGVIAPVLLAVGIAAGAFMRINGNGLVLAVVMTLMGVLVGWHYVKQGFGMAMVDAALKKRYWPAPARKALLMNAYAIWGAAWMVGNSTAVARNFWGVIGIDYVVPGPLAAAAVIIACGTTTWCGLAMYRCISQWRRENLSWKQWPLAGLVAYFITLYLWMGLLGLEPAFVLVIPFFHSLQYMTVVSRYKSNEASAHGWTRMRMVWFVMTAVFLGGMGFWLLPGVLDYLSTGQIPYFDTKVAIGIACAWIFINVHHYLIDNVLWRQGNPKVKQFLFDAQPAR